MFRVFAEVCRRTRLATAVLSGARGCQPEDLWTVVYDNKLRGRYADSAKYEAEEVIQCPGRVVTAVI